ncbi:MAG: hypothetical protein K6B14_04715 [Lachnospiraceae bacterium]|nr:hypothetical protein [Lachnospiraceae bacterium]
MTAVFSEIIEEQTGYFGEGWQYPIFAIVLVGLLLLWRRRDAAIAALYTVIMMVVIYCPVTAKFLMSFMEGGVYWRMFWLLPIIPVLALGMVEFLPLVVRAAVDLFKADDKKKKPISVIAVVLVLAIYAGLLAGGGRFVYQDGNVTWAHNPEKLPEEVIDIIDAVNADYEAAPVGEKRVAAVGTIVPFIRQYDATVLLAYGRSTIQKEDKSGKKAELYEQLTNAENPDYDRIAKLLKKTDTTYLIIADNMHVRASEMNVRGFETVYGNGAYTLLKRD